MGGVACVNHFACRFGRVRSHVERLARGDSTGQPSLRDRVAIAGLVDHRPERGANGGARSSSFTGAEVGTDLEAMLPRPSRTCVRRRRPRRAARCRRPAPAPRLPRAHRKADGDLDGGGARLIVGRGMRREASMRWCRTAGSFPACAASAGCRDGRCSANSRRSIATSSSARISAASARRWRTCCCSTWRSTRSMRRASCRQLIRSRSIATRPIPRARGTRTAPPPTRSSRWAAACVFTYRGSWCAEGANTSWESGWRIVGTRGHAAVGRRRRFRRALSSTATKASSAIRSPSSKCRRAADDARDPWACQRHRRFPRRHRQRRRRRRRVRDDNIKSLAMVFGAIESARHRPARRDISEGSR